MDPVAYDSSDAECLQYTDELAMVYYEKQDRLQKKRHTKQRISFGDRDAPVQEGKFDFEVGDKPDDTSPRVCAVHELDVVLQPDNLASLERSAVKAVASCDDCFALSFERALSSYALEYEKMLRDTFEHAAALQVAQLAEIFVTVCKEQAAI